MVINCMLWNKREDTSSVTFHIARVESELPIMSRGKY